MRTRSLSGITLLEVIIATAVCSIITLYVAKLIKSNAMLSDVNSIRYKLLLESQKISNEMKLTIRFARLRDEITNAHSPDFNISSFDENQPYSSLFTFFSTRDEFYHRYYQKDNQLIYGKTSALSGGVPVWNPGSEQVLSSHIKTLLFSKTEYADAGSGEVFPYIEVSITFSEKRSFLESEEIIMEYVDKLKLENI